MLVQPSLYTYSTSMPSASPYKTCDACRRKKVSYSQDYADAQVKCAPDVSDSTSRADRACAACKRSEEPCTFNRGYKKPGRPR